MGRSGCYAVRDCSSVVGRQSDRRPTTNDQSRLFRAAQSRQLADVRRARVLQVMDDVDRLLHALLAQRVAGLAAELVLDRLAAVVERPRAAAARRLLLR